VRHDPHAHGATAFQRTPTIALDPSRERCMSKSGQCTKDIHQVRSGAQAATCHSIMAFFDGLLRWTLAST
jgi:hypothetical protein